MNSDDFVGSDKQIAGRICIHPAVSRETPLVQSCSKFTVIVVHPPT